VTKWSHVKPEFYTFFSVNLVGQTDVGCKWAVDENKPKRRTRAAQHDPQTGAPQEWIALVNADKEKMIRLIRETVQRGGSIFSGPDSVVKKIGE